jgi:PhnB protein
MANTFSKTPAGYSTVCPFLSVSRIEEQIHFMTTVFNAMLKEKLASPDGSIGHAEMRIGDCVIMIGRPWGDRAHYGNTYVFVENVDQVFQTALLNGAKALMEPGDRFYGFREGGFTDPQGNQWWIASCFEELSMEELEKRAASAPGFKP